MKLIIAEKPNVAKDLKNALEPSAQFVRTAGSGYYKGSKFIITCSLGHIITHKQPKDIDEKYNEYSFEYIPFPIRPLPLQIGEGPRKGYYNTLRDVILKEKYDEIIVATDPDREGQGIYERIKRYMKGFPTAIPESRIWIKEWTKEGLTNAYRNRDKNSNYKGLGDAAECRAYDDYSFGMNGTVACTARFKNFLPVGRVQTAVNAIIVQRENQILNFVPQKYRAISLVIASDEPGKSLELKHKTEDKLSDEAAHLLYRRLSNYSSVKVCVSKKKTNKRPMKLGGQTDFLQVMNKKYGYDAKKTSDLLQTLYQDKKLTTYPGTEAHEISESAAKMALSPLKNLLGKVNSDIDRLIQKVFDNNWHIASHCVTNKELAHEAITPVFGSINADVISSLKEDEKNCYLEIVKRYLQAFYPAAQFEETLVETALEGEKFETKGKVLIEPGFLEVVGKGDDTLVPSVSDGHTYSLLEIKNEEKETKPPVRYTEDTLLDAMKNAGRFVEDKHYADILKSEEVEGIGTGRTRSVILDTLKKREYYVVKKKTIFPTQKAIDLINALPENIMITSPVMTAMLEEELKLVEEGKVSKEAHMDLTDKKVREMIEAIKHASGTVASKTEASIIAKCPKCGDDVLENSKAFSCSKKCGFVLFKEDKFFASLGKKMTKTYAKGLIEKRQVVVKDIVSKKTGNKYDLIVKADFSGQWPKYSTEFTQSKKKGK